MWTENGHHSIQEAECAARFRGLCFPIAAMAAGIESEMEGGSADLQSAVSFLHGNPQLFQGGGMAGRILNPRSSHAPPHHVFGRLESLFMYDSHPFRVFSLCDCQKYVRATHRSLLRHFVRSPCGLHRRSECGGLLSVPATGRPSHWQGPENRVARLFAFMVTRTGGFFRYAGWAGEIDPLVCGAIWGDAPDAVTRLVDQRSAPRLPPCPVGVRHLVPAWLAGGA